MMPTIPPESPRKIDPEKVEVVGVDQPKDESPHAQNPFGGFQKNFQVTRVGPWGMLLIPVLIPLFLILFLFLGLIALVFGSSVFKVIRYGQTKKH